MLTRRSLLDAARRVFAKKGFLNTEIGDIARDAGKSRGTFYNYIGGKTELLLALTAEFRDERLKLPTPEGERMYKEGRQYLRRLWELYRAHAATLDAVAQAAALDPLFAQEQRDLTKRGIENCRDLLRYMQSIGYCRHLDPEISGFILFTLINANMQQLFSPANAAELTDRDDALAFENLAKMVETIVFSVGQTESPTLGARPMVHHPSTALDPLAG
jgi:AcrR family transcriptional regulator